MSLMVDNDRLIERLAAGLFACHNNTTTWAKCHPYIKRTYRKYALSAIRVFEEIMVDTRESDDEEGA